MSLAICLETYLVYNIFYNTIYFYFQKKADVLYYDYGDNICEEGDMPQGIHLIVSGMVKVRYRYQ